LAPIALAVRAGESGRGERGVVDTDRSLRVADNPLAIDPDALVAHYEIEPSLAVADHDRPDTFLE
jgi:hypothetical protein